jgi:hypothetical protein
MSRRRIIDPSFWEDETVASWPLVSRLTYIAIWNHSDDYGFVRAAPSYLHSRCFPYDSNIDMKQALEPLVATERLLLYEVNGESYGQITSFRKWQTINRPSQWHNPTIDHGSRIPHGALKEDRLYQPPPNSIAPKNGTGPPLADTHTAVDGKPPDCSTLSEGSASTHGTLIAEVKLSKVKQPLPSVVVVKARPREAEQQLQPREVINKGVMGILEKQWAPGSDAEKVVQGWWKFYNKLGQNDGQWISRKFDAYRDQLLRVLNTGVDDHHMRLAIRYVHDNKRRRFMPNGDDTYRYPTTLFGKGDEPFNRVQSRIDTLMMEAVMWEASQEERQPVAKAPKTLPVQDQDENRRIASVWLKWLRGNRDRAVVVCKGESSQASVAHHQSQVKRWAWELEEIIATGEAYWPGTMHAFHIKNITPEEIKEIESAPQTTEKTEEAEAPADPTRIQGAP